MWQDTLRRPVVLAMNVAARPPRREHIEIMRRAREFYTWRGEEVLRGCFVPEGGSVIECELIARALRAAIEEEEGEGEWLECCRSGARDGSWVVEIEGDLTPVAVQWPDVSVVRV